jgi:hypothetical protein
VKGAANTLVVWNPTDFHGTSLQNVDPKDPNPPFVQSGLAIVTSNRIAGVFRKYAEQKITTSEAEDECFGSGYRDDESGTE